MSENKNEVVLTGRLKEFKFITTANGTEVFSGSLGTSRMDKKTNQWINSYFKIKAFKTTAIDLHSTFINCTNQKKLKVTVKGKLSSDSYTDKTGKKVEAVEIMVFSFEKVEESEQGFVTSAKAVEDVKSYNLKDNLKDDDFTIPF